MALEILDGSGTEAPPVDAFVVAQRLGITVATDTAQQGRGRFVRIGKRGSPASQAAILIRPEDRCERSHWTVAHEIGEAMAHRVFAVWGLDPRESSLGVREEVANCLAGRLLLPTCWFEPDGSRSGWSLPWLKGRYATASHELIARRMLDCGPAVIVTIFDQGRVHFRRSNVPGRVPPMSPSEAACWQSIHERNRPEQVDDGMRTIQGWPVHEENWKREILRREVEVEFADM